MEQLIDAGIMSVLIVAFSFALAGALVRSRAVRHAPEQEPRTGPWGRRDHHHLNPLWNSDHGRVYQCNCGATGTEP